jgi:hypothetical protein
MPAAPPTLAAPPMPAAAPTPAAPLRKTAHTASAATIAMRWPTDPPQLNRRLIRGHGDRIARIQV